MSAACSIFLLGADWEDRGGRTILRFLGRSPELGAVEVRIDGFRPVFFLERGAELPDDFPEAVADRGASGSAGGFPFERKPVELRSLEGRWLDALYFRSQHALRRGRDRLIAAGIQCYEADIGPCERFLMERFIHGAARAELREEPFEAREGAPRRILRNPVLRPELRRPELRMLSLDIETGVESGLLYSIAVQLTDSSGRDERRVFMLDQAAQPARGVGVNDAGQDANDGASSVRMKDDACVRVEALELNDGHAAQLAYFPDEIALMRSFLDWLRLPEIDPDVIIGWNVIGFDLRFLAEKCRRLGLPFLAGRTEREASVRQRKRGGDQASVPGRVVLDGPMTLRGAFYSFEDMRLESAARELLGRGKLIQEQDGRAKIQEIDRLFREDKPALARYNLEDCILVTDIFAKTELLALSLRRTEISGMLLDQIGRSVAAFDHVFLPRLHRKGLAAISMDDIEYDAAAPGGYVMDPESGLHDHVIVLDFRSLYPSIIRTFKIDPCSRAFALLEEEEDPIVTPDGDYRFARNPEFHILPDFIGGLLDQRARAKAEGDEHLSQAVKILMNSFYGVMGSPGCRFYHPALPSAITRTGQWLLRQSALFLEQRGYRALYGDTDSLFAALKPEDLADPAEAGRRIAAELTEYWRKRLNDEFRLESFLQMEFEKHFRKFFLPPARGGGGAKKRYAGLRCEPDGQGGVRESLQFAGMESVRSDWTELARDFQPELYARVFRDEDPSDYIRKLVQSLRNGELDAKLIYRKRLRKDIEEYTRSVPQHVRAARLLKRPGAYVRYLMTREGPAPVELNPQDIDYEHYIDKQLKPIADTLLGWLARASREGAPYAESGSPFDALLYPTQLSLF